jgi:hypothetical protein
VDVANPAAVAVDVVRCVTVGVDVALMSGMTMVVPVQE